VGGEGVEATFFLIKNSSSELQLDLLPVVIAAVNKGALPKAEFPGYFDLVRLKVGLKQMFGTQATLANGFWCSIPSRLRRKLTHDESNLGWSRWPNTCTLSKSSINCRW